MRKHHRMVINMSDKKQELKRIEKLKNRMLIVTTVAMLAMVLACCLFTAYQISSMEKGILDVCATQQDAYVQLVVDQINLKENRDDEEIINDILGTLDSSSNKYWTFSKDKAMLFVKDVIETNRYKGLTAISYYDSPSAKGFMENLEKKRVIHKNIQIDEKDYVASGVIFQYNGEDYRLCLLTNKEVILNNNKFMEAKIELIILVAFVLIVLLCVSMVYARQIEKANKESLEKSHTIRQLQGMVGHLNDLLAQKEQYDTRHQLWSKDVIEEFLHKLKKKEADRVVAVKICCQKESFRDSFLRVSCVLLDRKVLRFSLGEAGFYLLFLRVDKKAAEANIEPFLNKGTLLKGTEELDIQNMDIDEYICKLDAEVETWT